MDASASSSSSAAAAAKKPSAKASVKARAARAPRAPSRYCTSFSAMREMAKRGGCRIVTSSLTEAARAATQAYLETVVRLVMIEMARNPNRVSISADIVLSALEAAGRPALRVD